jgi:hypothetical protein
MMSLHGTDRDGSYPGVPSLFDRDESDGDGDTGSPPM